MSNQVTIRLFNPFVGWSGEYCTVGNYNLIKPLEELERHEINYRDGDAGPSWFVSDHGRGKLIGCVDRVDNVTGIDPRFASDKSGRRMSFVTVYELPPGSPVPPQSAWPELRRLVDADLRRAVQIVQDNKGAITNRQNDPIFRRYRASFRITQTAIGIRQLKNLRRESR